LVPYRKSFQEITLRYYIALCLIVTASLLELKAQDVPLFSQKLNNALIYNPSLAGLRGTSILLSHKRGWTSVAGAPVTNYLSFQTALPGQKIGLGVNILIEEVNVFSVACGSAAYAYHLPLSKQSKLSMGLSTEFTSVHLNTSKITAQNLSDPAITNFDNKINTDFSFGANYMTKLLNTGFSINRLKTAVLNKNENKILTPYYTFYTNFKIGMNRDLNLLEPSLVVRKLSTGPVQADLGLFYTHEREIILGLSYRTGNNYAATAGVIVKKKLVIGYSFEVARRKSFIPSHEMALKMSFELFKKNL